MVANLHWLVSEMLFHAARGGGLGKGENVQGHEIVAILTMGVIFAYLATHCPRQPQTRRTV